MSIKQTILGLCISAAALVGAVTTVSAAGGDSGANARSASPAGTLVAATPAAATIGAAAGSSLRVQAPASSFDDAVVPSEEALSASNLGLLALAALLSIGLLMTRRGGRA